MDYSQRSQAGVVAPRAGTADAIGNKKPAF